MQTKTKIIISIVVIATSFAFGRFTTPVKIKEVTKIVEVEKKSDTKDDRKDIHKHTVTKTIVRPDGTKETTTEVIEDSKSDDKSNSKDEIDKATDTSKEIVKTGGAVRIMAMGGVDTRSPLTSQFVGANISANIIGPIAIGGFAMTNGTAGLMLGLSF